MSAGDRPVSADMGKWRISIGLLAVGFALPMACASSSRIPPDPAALPGGSIVQETPVESVQALVAEGERWWTRSPDPGNPVACATCHDDPDATRGWAASFPKVKPMPPPNTRVMTLLQANAEAVARHYRLEDPLPAAAALTAYVTWLGAGLPISPGVSVGQPVFPDRMRALAASADRGSRVFARRCLRCHAAADIAPAATAFPRVVGGRVETLESFLEGHSASSQALPWDSPATADLVAYLVSWVKGLPIGLAIDPDRATGNVPCPGRPS